jgi:regulator of protease activity HflC (stomatin/prohibitin superfamily)
MEYLGFVILLALAVALLAANIRIVPQAHAYVIERLGAYQATWSVGVHVKVPLIDRVVKKISLKEQVIDFPPQPVITKDNVTMQIDTVIFFQITDPKLYTYGVERPISAIDYLTQTTLRNIIGDLELDETLTSREVINTKMRVILDEATDPWGIKINRVEVKNILPPKEIQNAMEKQMKAELLNKGKLLFFTSSETATLSYLGNIIPIGNWFVVSIGDIIAALGVILVVQCIMADKFIQTRSKITFSKDIFR